MNYKKIMLLVMMIISCFILLNNVKIYGVEFKAQSGEAVDPGPNDSSVVDRSGTYSYIVVSSGIYIDW